MRLQHLTPHQFEHVADNLDTVVASSYTPCPLDVAVPLSGSELIASRLADAVLRRYAGRASGLQLGVTTEGNPVDYLQRLPGQWPHPVRFALWLTDRTLTTDVVLRDGPVSVLCVDWWQWFRRRVAANRLSDVWMYLALACPAYWNSTERKQLGVEETAHKAMAEEGDKLFTAFEEWMGRELVRLWESHTGANG